MKVIELEWIGKKYKIYHEKQMITKTILFGWLNNKREEELWVLKNINLQVNKGETIGIIGENGSGKTTLLRILSGVTTATEGDLKIKDRVSSLLELGAGFHADLSGRENIYLNGSLLGLKKKDIAKKFDEIVEFSGLREFIDTPLRSYSSGMYLRLGFSVAMSVPADILLVDEVLSVGDEAFQRECIKKIKEFRDSGKTIVFASHDLEMILNLCDRVFLLSHGKILKTGKAADVVQFYIDTVGKREVAILQKGPLDVIFNRGRLSLYWRGKKITKGSGGFISMISSQRWHSSDQAEWEIKGKEEDKLVVQGRWLRLPITQTWELNILEDNSLCWQVDTVIEREDLGEQEQINLMLSDEYQRWFIDDQRETFPQIQTNNIIWEELFSGEPILKSVGISQDLKEKSQLPSVCFEPRSKDAKDIIKIFNSEYQNNARVLQYSNIDHQNKQRSLGIKIIFDLPDINNYIETRFGERLREIILNDRQLSCIFADNRVKAFWRDKELPQGPLIVKKYIEAKLRQEEERKR